MSHRVLSSPTQPHRTGPSTADRMTAAAARVRSRWPRRPKVGLVLGSGLHGLADVIQVDARFPFADLPGFRQPSAIGHSGQLACGTLAGLPVVACQGRVHAYEGYGRAQLAAPTKLFAELGCEVVVLSNAAGGVNPEFAVGDVMVITRHCDAIGSPRLDDWIKQGTRAKIQDDDEEDERTACDYDAELAEVAYNLGVATDRPVRRGTYAALNGPNYETRAEYRMLRTLGIDTVGMSTAPEASEAKQLGMRVLGLSVVTNVCDPDALGETCGEAVVAAASEAECHVRGLVWDVLSQLPS